MERFETEEQQVEAIKKFWRENGTAIIVGAVLGLGGLWGYRYYNEQELAAKEEASKGYTASLEALVGEETDISGASAYIQENSDTSYATLLALQLAKTAVDAGDLPEAVKQLQFAIEQNIHTGITAIAQTRLARVHIEQQDFDAALTTLEAIEGEAFAAKVDELKGDVYFHQGMTDKARAAYSAALEADESNRLLKMKLDDLAGQSSGA